MQKKKILILGYSLLLALPSCGFLHGYNRSVLQAKETVLREDLKILREAIGRFTQETQRRPQSLKELVDAGYVKAIPEDPFTQSANTWQIEISKTPPQKEMAFIGNEVYWRNMDPTEMTQDPKRIAIIARRF